MRLAIVISKSKLAYVCSCQSTEIKSRAAFMATVLLASSVVVQSDVVQSQVGYCFVRAANHEENTGALTRICGLSFTHFCLAALHGDVCLPSLLPCFIDAVNLSIAHA